MKFRMHEIVDDLDYNRLAVKSLAQPLLALYACCSQCGGDVGLNRPWAEFLDGVFSTGIDFCPNHGFECSEPIDSHEWVWTRMSRNVSFEISYDVEDELLEFSVLAVA
jgi:hypothetical protein